MDAIHELALLTIKHYFNLKIRSSRTQMNIDILLEAIDDITYGFVAVDVRLDHGISG
jgi:hypothetical protein